MRILIIDDDKDLARAITRMLQLLKQQAECAYSAGEAHARLAAGGVDAVLLDVVVGKDNGWDILVKIKEETPALPVVVMSGGSGGDDFEKDAAAFGAAAVLSKPFTLDALRAAIANLPRSNPKP